MPIQPPSVSPRALQEGAFSNPPVPNPNYSTPDPVTQQQLQELLQQTREAASQNPEEFPEDPLAAAERARGLVRRQNVLMTKEKAAQIDQLVAESQQALINRGPKSKALPGPSPRLSPTQPLSAGSIPEVTPAMRRARAVYLRSRVRALKQWKKKKPKRKSHYSRQIAEAQTELDSLLRPPQAEDTSPPLTPTAPEYAARLGQNPASAKLNQSLIRGGGAATSENGLTRGRPIDADVVALAPAVMQILANRARNGLAIIQRWGYAMGRISMPTRSCFEPGDLQRLHTLMRDLLADEDFVTAETYRVCRLRRAYGAKKVAHIVNMTAGFKAWEMLYDDDIEDVVDASAMAS